MDDFPDLVSINFPASSKTCIKAVAISRNVLNGIPFFPCTTYLCHPSCYEAVGSNHQACFVYLDSGRAPD
eukprot:7382921-Heterocapsa_arctica.AAC.1